MSLYIKTTGFKSRANPVIMICLNIAQLQLVYCILINTIPLFSEQHYHDYVPGNACTDGRVYNDLFQNDTTLGYGNN